MLIVNVKDHGSIERALKVLKRKVSDTQQLKELRARKEFVKPCEVRRQTGEDWTARRGTGTL